MAENLTIGALARRAATKVQTIRFYEQEGLMPEPARSEGGQRRYTKAHADRLAFIRHARELGCRFYYPGYAYRGPSFYDYKKNFSGLEFYDWETGWKTYQGATEP